MESVTAANLKSFLQRLGERYPGPATIYLLGGSALCLLGSPRVTLDVDYTVEVAPEDTARFQAVLAELAAEMRLDLEDVQGCSVLKALQFVASYGNLRD